MPAINTAKMTARQFLELGEDPPGVRLELVDGEIEVSPSPTPDHSHVDRRLTQILLNHLDQGNPGKLYGDVDTLFDDLNIRRPDILYFSKDRLHLVGPKAMEGPPDLAIEIVSPSSATIDRRFKFDLYEKAGVAHYWIIDPHPRTFEAYALTGGRYQCVTTGRDQDTVSAPPFGDLSLPLGKLWQ